MKVCFSVQLLKYYANWTTVTTERCSILVMRIICLVFGKMALDNSIKVRMLVNLEVMLYNYIIIVH